MIHFCARDGTYPKRPDCSAGVRFFRRNRLHRPCRLWRRSCHIRSDNGPEFVAEAPDGGIDAVVNAMPKSPGNGLIFAPRTSYQVKTGDFTLNATSPGQIEKILMSPKR